MQSHGGLADAPALPRQGQRSSPAPPAASSAPSRLRRGGLRKLIGFDMGGTSTDVSHFAGEFERSTRARSPASACAHRCCASTRWPRAAARSARSRAAATGRAAQRRRPARAGLLRPRRPADRHRLQPDLGQLQPSFFPHVFGADGAEPVDEDAARAGSRPSPRACAPPDGEPPAPEQLADGFMRIACERMANAIKKISTQRGHDVTGHALCCFGGAAGQHACQVADALGMTASCCIRSPACSAPTAWGWPTCARCATHARASLGRAADAAATAVLAELEDEAVAELARQGFAAADVSVERRGHVKYSGTDVSLPVPWGEPATMGSAFLVEHEARYGFLMPGRELTLEAVSVEAIGAGGADGCGPRRGHPGARGRERRSSRRRSRQDAGAAAIPEPRGRGGCSPAAATTRRPSMSAPDSSGRDRRRPGDRLRDDAAPPSSSRAGRPRCWAAASCFCAGSRRRRGHRPTLDGRPRCCSRSSTTCSCPSPSRWARRSPTPPSFRQHQGTPRLLLRPVRRRWRAGRQRAAPARAPRVHGRHRAGRPRAASAARMRPGDVFMLNAPYNGGTHLPDITVVTPVFGRRHRRPRPPAALLRRHARPPRRHRRRHARVDAARQPDDRRGRRAHRELPARRRRPPARG